MHDFVGTGNDSCFFTAGILRKSLRTAFRLLFFISGASVSMADIDLSNAGKIVNLCLFMERLLV
jgi:hypothetical protein